MGGSASAEPAVGYDGRSGRVGGAEKGSVLDIDT